MLQSLLQPRETQRSKMIGAMPAVAVRHERRRAEKRSGGGGGGRRPSQLPLQLGRPLDPDATPSPDAHRLRNELYVCGKVAALHAIVGSLLLGVVVLVVGLVQLSPGAEAAQHRYYLMGAGAALVGGGALAAVLRCVCLHWFKGKYGGGGGGGGGEVECAGGAHKAHAHPHQHAHAVGALDAAHTHGAAAAPHHQHQHQHQHRHKLRTQPSVSREPSADLAPASAPTP